ncbi:MAG: family 20 glycosylhydrolase [Gammaproteobacteria bacterium]
MRRAALGLVAPALLATCECFADTPPPLVPLPAEIVRGQGEFPVGPGTVVRVPGGDAEAADAARYLVEMVARTRGAVLAVRNAADGAGAPAITFERAPGLGAEAYRLEVTPRGTRIVATSSAGLFYGAVTFWQLLPVGKGATKVPAQVIHDAPVYAWRGLMLDSARHFQSPQFVKSMIDWMAWHKLNILQWHLTDDQGWRIEIRKYPRLASAGSCRVPATAGPVRPPEYCGYYTQAQVREIVAYAASRHIQIVPEIEVPGHAQAAIAAYPSLGAINGPAPPVSAKWGIHTYLFNLEPQTFTFLEDVLTEVMDLFPSPYIHVGGDEAVKDQWIASPSVQARGRALGIDDPEALQTWFTQEIGRFLVARGRRLVGWDEILRPGFSKDAIVMSWHGAAGAHAAAIAGNDTVLSPWPTLYFDNRQSALPSEPPGRMRVVSLEEVYRFEPRDSTLTEDQQKHLLGLQANIWTEHIRTGERVELMALPRAAAIAEVGWTPPDRRDWSSFLQRLVPTFAKYRAMGLRYDDSAFGIDARVTRAADAVLATLANQTKSGEIRYTTDGRDPTASSSSYSSPLRLSVGAELRAATFMGGERMSDVWSHRLDSAFLAGRSSRELDLCSDGISLLLEPDAFGSGARPLFAIDIMNPCWIYRDVDLTRGARLVATAGQLPFNFEIGADAQKIQVGDSRTTHGELEVRIDGCEASTSPPLTVPLAPLPPGALEITLPQINLPARPGRHDVCLRFARPQLDPMWALDRVEITP